MSRDYEPISSRAGRGPGTRSIALLLAIAFIGGAIAAGWILTRSGGWGERSAKTERIAAETLEPVTALQSRIGPDGTVQPEPSDSAAPIAPSRERALANRVADLEDRLSRINVQAQAASGNAARAEGLLIAFAARRALDRGSPLGYIEGQLKLRFGQAQPNAVATIIETARQPVTVDQLRTALDEEGPRMISGRADDEGLWSAITREASELFVLRREGTPSPLPAQRLHRAQRFLEAGWVEEALAEVRRLPSSPEGAEWIRLARRYIAARQALDLIETAAILEPRALRSGDGAQVREPSPLAPEGAAAAAALIGYAQ